MHNNIIIIITQQWSGPFTLSHLVGPAAHLNVEKKNSKFQVFRFIFQTMGTLF